MLKKKLQPPKQYVQGYCEFYKLKIKLTPDVLIPRPETELIVDFVLSAIGNDPKLGFKAPIVLPPQEKPFTVVDIGTGSGCIPIAIAKNSTNTKIIAIDTSFKALEVAKKNAKFHRVERKIFFVENDLLNNFKQSPDIITANLPYIPTARLMHIDPMVRDFEPKLALDGGYDGFEIYRKLFAQMKNQQIKPQLLIAEIDEKQSDIAKVEAKRYFPGSQFEVVKDLAKKNRFLTIRF
jgi:release factor glutamine methyltransferase